jgi:catechol 2,3-dioxygenase-like lactoylglutathione lyase family enzyme
MSMRLYRVILPVDDLEAGARFYSTLLGVPGARVSPGRHYFACGEVTLALYSPRADGDARTPRPNFDHVYFAADDLEDVYRRAQQLGCLSTAIGDGGLPMGQIAVRPWRERSF